MVVPTDQRLVPNVDGDDDVFVTAPTVAVAVPALSKSAALTVEASISSSKVTVYVTVAISV